MKVEKKHFIVVAAIILPFGLVVLGLWKTYELLKKEKQNETNETQRTIN